MLRKISVNIFPVGGRRLFTKISDHFPEIARLVTAVDPSIEFSETSIEDREWFPADRIMPPHCPYEDSFKVSYRHGDYSAENFVKVHSERARVMGDHAYGFFEVRQAGEVIFAIGRSRETDFEKIEFSYGHGFTELQIMVHSLKLLEILDLEEMRK